MKRVATLAMLMAGSSLSAVPSIAAAQAAAPTAQATPTAAQAEPAAPASPADDVAQDIVVTGSRIASNGNNSPTPVTVVTNAALANAKPTTLIDALNDLPVFSGSKGQQSNPIGAGIAGAGSPAANQLNLRNLGAIRTLVLFDGQRVAPTTIAGVVDADIIPQMLVDRVEVVTGGTSAVYGSDAVAGVVNFIPDKKFKGIKLEGQFGETQHADNRNWKAGIAVGKSFFDDRLHLEASYEHYDDRGITDRYARDWNKKYAVVGAGTQASPYVLLSNVRNNTGSFGGLITSGVLKDQQFAANGALSTFTHGTATATSTAEIGGDGYYQTASLVAPLTWDQMFLRGDLKVSDTVNFHFQAARDKKSNTILFNWPALTGLTLSSSNAFLPAAVQAKLAAAGQTTFGYGKILNQEPPLTPMITSDQIIANAGFDGKIGKFHWDVSGNYGKTTLHNNFAYNQNNENLSAALDAVVDPSSGQVVCRSSITNPGAHPGCVPLNIFGPTSASQAALDYVFRTTHYTAHTSTYDVNGSVSGSLFDTWAGPVQTALSAEWRKTEFDSNTDADATSLANCTGLRYNCNSKTLLYTNAFGNRSPVSVNVKEIAGEAEVPLIKNVRFIDSFGLNGAIRYTQYSTSGSYLTWKVGGDWRVSHELRIRGTVSRDIRAPTLNDLFAPATIQVSTNVDQLTNTSPNAPSFRAGNPNLKAEIGYTQTAGFVYSPNWAPRFNLAIDVFRINVKNAIVEVKGDDPVVQRACYASGGSSPYCALQDRPLGYTNTTAANAVTAWRQFNINVSKLSSWGLDVEANYAGNVVGRPFTVRSFLTWQPHTIYSQPGLADVDTAGSAYGPTPVIANPSVRVTLSESLEVTKRFRIDLQQRYRNAMTLSGDESVTVACCKVPAVVYFEANLSYKVPTPLGMGEIFLNMQNLLDQDPPASSPPGTTTPGAMGGYAIGDDPLGRSFVAGFRFKL